MEAGRARLAPAHPATRRLFGRERGSTAVEFALVLPVLLLLIFGIIDFARLVTTYTTVRSAAREAVRYGSVLGDSDEQYEDCAGIRNAAKNVAVVPPLTDSNISIRYVDGSSTAQIATCPPGSIDEGDRLEVTVSRAFVAITPLLDTFLDGATVTSTSRRTIRPWE